MKINPITNVVVFKKKFNSVFNSIKTENPLFEEFIESVIKKNYNIYIIGGFLRDVANDKISRDVDIMVSLPYVELDALIKEKLIVFQQNRLKGYKLKFNTITVDCWSEDNNWAFEKKLIKRNDKYLDSIANGTFFNFDSIVLHLNTLKLHTKNYNHCIKEGKLDILKKNKTYKNSNPTSEANIIKAIYLAKNFDLKFSPELQEYIFQQINSFKLRFYSFESRLYDFQNKYDKYKNFLNEEILSQSISTIIEEMKKHNNEFEIKNQVKLF